MTTAPEELQRLLADGDDATQLARARAEIARLRAELAGAEERGRRSAAAEMLARVDSQGPAVVGRIIEQAEERGRQLERADVLSHLRRDHCAFIAAGDIERGEHVRTGTTPPDAG